MTIQALLNVFGLGALYTVRPRMDCGVTQLN